MAPAPGRGGVLSRRSICLSRAPTSGLCWA